jgi:hypothetical protein
MNAGSGIRHLETAAGNRRTQNLFSMIRPKAEFVKRKM